MRQKSLYISTKKSERSEERVERTGFTRGTVGNEVRWTHGRVSRSHVGLSRPSHHEPGEALGGSGSHGATDDGRARWEGYDIPFFMYERWGPCLCLSGHGEGKGPTETRPAAHYTRRWRRKKATGAVGRGERGKELMNGGFYYGRSPLPPHLTARRQYNNNDWIGRNDRDDHSTSIRSEPHPLAQTGESQRRGDRWEWLTRTRSGLKAMSEWSYLCPKASSPGGLGDQQFPS